jgi:hypothetical protein
MSVNYLLAASSHRANRWEGAYKGKLALKLHLEQLAKTDLLELSQITIIRALPLYREKEAVYKEYWDIKQQIKELKCRVEFLDVPDSWFSYSSWIHAIKKFGNMFDYYVLIEDDFYPARLNFVSELIKKHKELLPLGGYLNSFTALDHAAVSNGFVNAQAFIKAVNKHEDPIEAISPAAQVLFSDLFDHFDDYTDEYRCLRYGDGIVELTHDKKLNITKDMFNPLQCLFLDYPFPVKSVSGRTPR